MGCALRHKSSPNNAMRWAAVIVVAIGSVSLGDASAASAAGGLCFGRAATISGTSGQDRLVGTRGADVIVAGKGNDLIRGRGGNDRICPGAGWDRVRAGDGDDRVDGGSGGDTLAGDAGTDRLRGGTGTDTFLLTGDGDTVDGEAPKSTDWVDYGLAASAADVDLEAGTGSVASQSSIDHITGVRSMFGSPFGDTLRGDSGQTVAIGNRGDDTIEGRGGNDSLRGGTGDDMLDGGPGFDNLDGALGIDTCLNGEGFARCDVISP